MPGLLGIVQTSPDPSLPAAFERALALMCRGDRFRSEKGVKAEAGWALGRVHLGVLQPDSQLQDVADIHVLFHGELYNEPELQSLVAGQSPSSRGPGVAEGSGPEPRSSAVRLIAALYRRFGSGFPAYLKGTFSAVVLDLAGERLVLASDAVGSYPLYWFNGPTRFMFAGELKAVMSHSELRRRPDPSALADTLWFGFVLGDKTLAEGVNLLPAGCALTYRWRDHVHVVERFRTIDQMFRPFSGSKADYLQQVTKAFGGAMERASRGPGQVGMSLSGGLDSRAILSAVPRDRFPIFTYTLGVKGCADQVIAARLSAIAGTSHRYFELNERYLQDYFSDLSQLVGLTDGMYLSHGLTEMLALRFLERESLSVLLRGHGGELAKMSLAWPFHVDQRISSMQTRAELVDYLHARFGYMSRGVNLRDLFSDDWSRAMDGQARRSLEAALPDADLRPSELCAYLYIAEGLRRYTVQSLEMFRSITEIRLPFADADYLEALLQGDPSWREGTEIHQAIVAANYHALLKVRNSNTGARVNAHPLEERVLDKMNTLFKRLNVYGYRHYHNFDAWMGRMLLASVETTLLGPQALARGMFRKSAIERLIEDTKKGAHDHGYLLQALLIFELWQQQNDL